MMGSGSVVLFILYEQVIVLVEGGDAIRELRAAEFETLFSTPPTLSLPRLAQDVINFTLFSFNSSFVSFLF